MSHVFYLHGFASSVQSSKARFLGERLAAHGIMLRCPDFNAPDFSTLTISRMLEQVGTVIEALPPGDVVLIGSSLGAFVAVELAARSPARGRRPDPDHPIERLILLAPALALDWDRWLDIGHGGLAAWRETDRLDVFHYGYGETRALKFAFYEDPQQYDPFNADLSVPTLIVQGWRDTSVNPTLVAPFARARPAVDLHLVDDDHQLLGSLETIWRLTATALGLPMPGGNPASSA